ncbi:MAG: hypothetical protein R3E66_03505 [bacterium]
MVDTAEQFPDGLGGDVGDAVVPDKIRVRPHVGRGFRVVDLLFPSRRFNRPTKRSTNTALKTAVSDRDLQDQWTY